MKIKDFCKRMNNHGTYPRIWVYKRDTIIGDCILIYEGNPYGVPAEIGKMPINSFTVMGVGSVIIYTA